MSKVQISEPDLLTPTPKIMTIQLTAEETLSDGLRRILLELIDESISLLTNPTDNFDDAVHNARKNGKKLRAVLRLIRDELGAEVYKRENVTFRDVSRVLATVRDSWVIVATLDSVKERFQEELAAAALASMRAKLVDQYEEVRAHFLADETILPQAIKTFEAARERIAALPLVDDTVAFDAVEKGVERVYKRGRNAMSAAYEHGDDPHLFHNWRKRVKYMWHQTEVLNIVWPVYMTELAQELHALSDHLGDAHDLAVLHQILLDQTDVLGDEPELEQLLELIAQRQAELEAAARPLGERMYVEKPAAFTKRLAMYWQVWQKDHYNGLPPEPEQPPLNLLSTKEAAAHLDISVRELLKQIHQDEIPAHKVGSMWVIVEGDLPNGRVPEDIP